MPWNNLKKRISIHPLQLAVASNCEPLEKRRLMAGTPTAQPLPIDLTFAAPVAGTLVDSASQGTGFTYAQPNKNSNEYQPALIQLLPAQKQLKLITTGTSAAGGPWETDNTLVNGLQDGFNAVASPFTITTRLQGPLSILNNPSDQGGILFGPDDDNYVKLVAISQPTGQVLQFVDEQQATTHAIATANSYTNIGSFSSINTLDLQIQANPSTGKITASYAINGGAMVAVSQSLTLTGSEASAFFSADSLAGIIAMAKNNLAPIAVTFDSFSIAAVPANTGGSTAAKLTGTIIGTPGSYDNQGNTIGNAFDGDLTTFVDAATASGNWVGLNLGAPATITQIKFAPRATLPTRMLNGIFQGSNTADFSSGVVNLFTITNTPTVGVLTTQAITNTGTFQYVRYLSPAMSYGNIAELEFDGTTAATAPTSTKLTGTIGGTAGSYSNFDNTFANAFDSNFNTFFDAPTGNGDYVSEAFSSEALITQIQYAPRTMLPSRMVGGIFQASNNANFSTGVVNLYTITAAPAAGVFTTVPIITTTAYKYARYLAPAGSYGNIAELEFDGTLTGQQPAPVILAPSVTSSSPANNATNVDPTGFVSCALNLPNVGEGVNPGTLTASTVYLFRTFDGVMIPSELNTDAAGSVIVLQPESPLDANTSYTFVVTSGVQDGTGTGFIPYQSTFTTGAQTTPVDPNIAFAKVALPTATGQLFTGVTMGPDGDLYANTETGQIYQFPVNIDGTLGTPFIYSLPDSPRLITGIAFDPSSTATNMKIWISSGAPQYSNAPDFSGEISAVNVTGRTFSGYQAYIVGLPRSNSNHLNDQPVFGPDGALYWCQGSNSSMGAPDSVWGFRPEHLLNAAILRLNIQLVEQYVTANKTALNVQTDTLPAGQTAYNPYAAGAPLTLYATGIRNAYDLIWDSNGHLYAPTNGSAAGGNIPATPAGVTPAAPAENNVLQAEDDYLYDIVPGGYYGHPDPARGQYIFGGGNPTTPAADDAIQTAYPLGTNPDPNYQGFAFDFGVHYSPDGSIEYTGNAFGGALNGALLITRYSGGKDIIVLRTGANGQITNSETGITGFTQFNDPVDVIEDPRTGDLYVAELGGEKLTLLRPIASGAAIAVSSPTLNFNAVSKAAPSPAQTITISNTGNQPLAIPGTGLSLIGSDATLFVITSRPALPATIAPGGSVTLSIEFNPGSSAIGLHTAQLQIASNDPNHPLSLVNLDGLTTAGLGGSLEPL